MAKTTKTIRISDEVYKELGKRAKGLSDTPDKILRRLLGLKDEKEKETKK